MAGLGRRRHIEKHNTACQGRGSVPEEHRPRICLSKQKANQKELVAALLPYLTLPLEFAGRPILLHWTDNIAALADLTKEYSMAPDLMPSTHGYPPPSHLFGLNWYYRRLIWPTSPRVAWTWLTAYGESHHGLFQNRKDGFSSVKRLEETKNQ